MNILNMLFTGLFTVEMVLKLIAFKPKVGPQKQASGTQTPEGRVGGAGTVKKHEGQESPVKDHSFSDNKCASS